MTNDQLDRVIGVCKVEIGDAVWLWFSADSSDRLFTDFISAKTTSPSYAIFSQSKQKLIVSTLDADVRHDMEVHVYGGNISLPIALEIELKELQWPETIYLNFSKSGDPKVDTLGHGLFLRISRQISSTYKKNGRPKPAFLSAESLFYSVIERRSERQLLRMRTAAARALDVIRTCLLGVREGMSEREIYQSFQTYTKISTKMFCEENQVVKEEFAWNKEFCPIVLVGPNLVKGGHAETSDHCIRRGDTIYADFGVKLTFEDGVTVSSDLQRMAYLLNIDEKYPPKEVLGVFNTLVSAIDAGIQKAAAGVFGHEVDDAVRSVITSAGYPSYDHSTGHPIGEVAHSPGTLIAPRENPRARKKLRDRGTYTIEPRIQIANGGSIEEMVLVTEEGCVSLCERQRDLWIVS
jgi:Xaa-Pro aminopeptidase